MVKDFIKRKLTAYLQAEITPNLTEATTTRLLQELRREKLLEAALQNKEAGVVAPTAGETPVIVSLTTYGKRFYEVCTTIESIMQGTVKPNGIVLWRDETDHRPLPLTLQRQVERGLQVLGTRDLRSYTKLLPTLKMFPDAHIVTIDDDIFYPHDFLENLMATYAKKPHSIVGNMVMQMSYDSNGIPTGILQWPYLHEEPADGASHDLFFEGFGGVFYPAGSLPEEVFHKEVFQDICPTADDVWFNAMARISKTPITFCEHGYYDYLKADNHVCQDTALNLINNSENRNDKQLRAVWQRYHLQGQ